MDFKTQILEIAALAYEINENTPTHVSVDYVGLMAAIRVFIYNKSEGFEKPAKEMFTVRREGAIMAKDVSPEYAIARLAAILKESEVAA